MSALDQANQVRSDRAKLRMRVTAGEVAAWKIVEDAPACVAAVDVFTFVGWLPHVSHIKAARMLKRLGIASHKRMADLTDLQRDRLSQAIHDYQQDGDRATRRARDAARRADHPAQRGLS